MMTDSSKFRGITLIEAVIVLGIASMLTAGVWTAAASAIYAQKSNELLKQTEVVVQNMQRIYGNTKVSLLGLTTTSAIKSGIFPAAMVVNNTTVQHAFQGSMYVNGTGNSTVSLTFSDLPQSACTNLALKMFANKSDADLKRKGISAVMVNGLTFGGAFTIDASGHTTQVDSNFNTGSTRITSAKDAAQACQGSAGAGMSTLSAGGPTAIINPHGNSGGGLASANSGNNQSGFDTPVSSNGNTDNNNITITLNF